MQTDNRFVQVTVKNFNDIQRAVQPFLPNSDPKKEKSIRKTLIDGMDVVKRHLEYKEKQKSIIEKVVSESLTDEFLKPMTYLNEDPGGYNVDLLIRDRLAGKRERLLVTWALPEGKFSFNPYTGELKSC